MHRIVLFIILLMLVPDTYIYFVHIAPATRQAWLRALWWLPSTVIILLFVGFLLRHGLAGAATHMQTFSRLGGAIVLFLAPKLLFVLPSLVGVIVHGVIRPVPQWPFTVLATLVALVTFAGMAYGLAYGTKRFEVKEVEYRSARLPQGFDGYRIVQISDLHIGGWAGNTRVTRRFVDLVNRQGADLIAFTGDLVNQVSTELDEHQAILAGLSAPDGVYSILGNHDYGTYYPWPTRQAERDNLRRLIDAQAQMGWQLLNNDHTLIHHRGDSIALLGVENDGEPPFPQMADLERAMQGTEGLFRILLSHNPTHWRREVLPQSDIDLTLSGHTHAMQVCLFGWSPASLKYPEWGGMYHEGQRVLYVNVGIGGAGLPFRIGAWPEITVITLRREATD